MHLEKLSLHKKKLCFFLFFLLSLSSQYILPSLLGKNDFGIFSDWALFTGPSKNKIVYDLMFLPSKQLFFTGIKTKGNGIARIKLHLFLNFNFKGDFHIPINYAQKMKNLFEAREIYLVKYKKPMMEVMLEEQYEYELVKIL